MNFVSVFAVFIFIRISDSLIETQIYHDSHVCPKQLGKSQSTGEKPKYCYRNFDDYGNDYCLQLNRIGSKECYVNSINALGNDVTEVFQHLSKSDVDTNSTIQAIRISFYDKVKHRVNSTSSLNYTMIGESLDEFLIPRPWWRVIYEPYPWLKTTHMQAMPDGKSATTESRHSLLANNQIMLKKVDQRLMPYLEYIAKIQYPSERICSISPLILGFQACGHPGWTSVVHTYYGDKQRLKYGKFTSNI